MAGLRRLDLSPNLNAGTVATDEHIRYYWLAAEQATAEVNRPGFTRGSNS
jgi:hypothetical protein